MCEKSAEVVVNVNVSIKMPEHWGANRINKGSPHCVPVTENNLVPQHRSRNQNCSASPGRNECKSVVRPCLNRSPSSNSASPATSPRSDVDRAVRSEDSIIAMGHALPDCFGANPYFQNISPSERSLNKRERCLDSVREIACLPSDLFTKVKDSPVRAMVVEKEIGQNSVDSPSVNNSSTKVRNRWFSENSLRELAAIPLFSKQGVGQLLPKDISVSPTTSPVAPRPFSRFVGTQTQQQNDPGVFSISADYFVNPDDATTGYSPQSATHYYKHSLIDINQNKSVRRHSLGSLQELSKLPSISKIGLNDDMRSPYRIRSPVEQVGSSYDLSWFRSKELPQQYYTLDSVKVPSGFSDSRRPLFFLAKPIQPNDKMQEPILLFGYPNQVSVRLGSTNPYAYLPKQRPVMSSESLIDINQVPLTFSPRVQEKEHK